ncbi:16S rRNA (cytidine(1402)-2'-O)-methyltransferase [uncultured Parasphingopyxis sp.]|uniref:16S rRNA (cytidine(1402)-2'-O)-methyltransferase n=1 Tax=uncultured Parasphingopyxis sp. TaxID=1547918 RepID=UPI00262208D9|nr:16S rRNA (cytidine(1402)-2'-O)-methyltransferase [uncultured Parasphingopyxis sp.]
MIETLQPGLYIVATPIGNLQDITFRAVDVLKRADAIAAEDSRVTAKLLNHLEIRKPIIRYDDHSDAETRARIVERLGSEAIALVSDAGTPLISDPGFKLVREAKAAGHYVTTLPGPSAAIAALTLAGLPTDRFLFAGFLPAKAKARDDAIAELKPILASIVLYESGPRLGKALAALAGGLGNREAAVVREISKRFEESATGTLAGLADRYADAPPKGEIVIVIGPPGEAEAPDDEALDTALVEALDRLAPGKAAAEVAGRFGLKRGDLYDRALALKESR